MIYLITAFLTFLITVIATPYLIDFLHKRDILDKPNGEKRRIHTEPIPRMGGIIIFTVIIIVTFAFYQDVYSKKFFLSGAMLVFVLGLLDDFKSVKWQIKFLVQSVAAVLLILSLQAHNFTEVRFLGYTLPYGLDFIVLFMLIVGLLNAFNLMDGLDGLVAGFSLIIASMCFLLSLDKPFIFLPYLSTAIIGSTLGFLKFNANPARIFLGDSGSFVLGYLITSLVLAMSGEASLKGTDITQTLSDNISLTFVIIALAVPIIDTLRVMYVRIKERKNPFLPDKNHLHHILYSKNIRHKTVVMLIHIISMMFALLAMFYALDSKTTALVIFAVFVIMFLFIDKILSFVIKKENLLLYGKLYKKVPGVLPNLYRNAFLPLVTLILIVMMIFLIINEIQGGRHIYAYFLIILIPSFIYSSTTLKKKQYYAELLVLINFIMFFMITGLNGFFYKLYPVPFINQLNINQIFIGIMSFMIIVFVLFKERIANIRQQFLNGTDLTVAVLIMFVYIAVQFIGLPESYKISDTLLRSFLVFLIYKIIVAVSPKLHMPLYYISFSIAVIAIAKSII